MDESNLPTISSFVVRFVVESAPNSYRGAIRHVQSNEEIQFNAWPDALAFMQRYVPLEIAPAVQLEVGAAKS